MANLHHATSAIIGTNFLATSSTAEFSVGTRAFGTDASEWVYVKATTALTQYDAAAIDEDYNAAPLTKALADAGHRIGWAQVAFPVNYFGWLCLSGSVMKGRVAASCAADVALYTTATAGVLDDDATSQTKVNGIRIVTAGTSSGVSAREIIATNPWT